MIVVVILLCIINSPHCPQIGWRLCTRTSGLPCCGLNLTTTTGEQLTQQECRFIVWCHRTRVYTEHRFNPSVHTTQTRRNLSSAACGAAGNWPKTETWVKTMLLPLQWLHPLRSGLTYEVWCDVLIPAVLLEVDRLQLWLRPAGDLHKSVHCLQKKYTKSAMWGRCEPATSKTLGLQVCDMELKQTDMWGFSLII